MKKGNPAWVKGKSPYPQGRPRGQNTLAAYYKDPSLFEIKHIRWQKFCWQYILCAGRGARAARNAGYSPRSARFIASRLIRKPVIRAIWERCQAKVYLYSITGNMEWSCTGDVVEKRRQFEERARQIKRNL
jgi:hypothetical protein